MGVVLGRRALEQVRGAPHVPRHHAHAATASTTPEGAGLLAIEVEQREVKLSEAFIGSLV